MRSYTLGPIMWILKNANLFPENTSKEFSELRWEAVISSCLCATVNTNQYMCSADAQNYNVRLDKLRLNRSKQEGSMY